MLTILHISDLHFGPPFLPRVGEALLRMVPRIAPDVIIVSGDLTQRAKRDQFADARAYLDRLGEIPMVVIPGNHDVPLYRIFERLLRPHDRYCEFFKQGLNHVMRLEGAVIVCLDSTAPRRAITNGRIDRDQLAFCTESFKDVPTGTSKIVVAHHHFAPAPDYETVETMPKAKRAINHFVELEVDLIFGGHLHRAYIGNTLDFYPGAHRDRGIIIVQCGTTTSGRGRAREREKNSFNVVRIKGEMLDVMHYMYFSDDDAFQPMSRHTFPRPGRHFVEE